MGKIRTYIKPFDDAGNYLSDFIEVSDSVVTVGDVSRGIDSSDFEIGVTKNSSLSLRVQNNDGKFSDVTNLNSIFKFKRKDSIVKITYDQNTEPLICGFFRPGVSPLGLESTLFEGVLNEVSSLQNIKEQEVQFTVLGYDSKLQETETPFSSLDVTMDYETLIFTCLDTAPFNHLVTVSSGNINCGLNFAPDTIGDLENKTVAEALAILLRDSVSVLYINRNNEVIVSPRDAALSLSKTFYGAASQEGIEDILNISDYRDGANRVKNFFTWRDTALVQSDATSVSTFGVQKTELDSSLINVASTTKINNILTDYKDAFRLPKVELTLLAPLTYANIGLSILDKVNIDYPTVYDSLTGGLAYYGASFYEQANYPAVKDDLTISTSTEFKVLNIKISAQKNTITLKLREV